MSDVALAPLPVPAGAARRRPSPRPEAAPPAGTGPAIGRARVQLAAADQPEPELAERTGRCRYCGVDIQHCPTGGPSTHWVHLGPGGTFRCRDATCGLLLDSYAAPADRTTRELPNA